MYFTLPWLSIVAKCLRTLSSLFSPDLVDQSSCRIMTTYAKARPILHADWPIKFGEDRPDMALKHMAAILPGYTTLLNPFVDKVFLSIHSLVLPLIYFQHPPFLLELFCQYLFIAFLISKASDCISRPRLI